MNSFSSFSMKDRRFPRKAAYLIERTVVLSPKRGILLQNRRLERSTGRFCFIFGCWNASAAVFLSFSHAATLQLRIFFRSQMLGRFSIRFCFANERWSATEDISFPFSRAAELQRGNFRQKCFLFFASERFAPRKIQFGNREGS